MSVDRGFGPDFLCVGAQKGGTRWLYDQLSVHPDFWMPPIKELHYFDWARSAPGEKQLLRAKRNLKNHRKAVRRLTKRKEVKKNEGTPLSEIDAGFLEKYIAAIEGPMDLPSYAGLFAGRGKRITGDITPGYSSLNEAQIDGLLAAFPSLKIVFLAREPVERLWSQYCMDIRTGKVEATADPTDVLAFAKRRYVENRSFPSQIVGRWRARYPASQFGLFFFDDLKNDAAELRRRILTFLGADPDFESPHVASDYNRKGKLAKIEMSPEIRAALIDYFANELQRCAEELGGPAIEWRDRQLRLNGGP